MKRNTIKNNNQTFFLIVLRNFFYISDILRFFRMQYEMYGLYGLHRVNFINRTFHKAFVINQFFWEAPFWLLELCSGFIFFFMIFIFFYCVSFFFKFSHVILFFIIFYLLFLIFTMFLASLIFLFDYKSNILFCISSKVFTFGFKFFGFNGLFYTFFVLLSSWSFRSLNMPLTFLLKINFTYERVFVYVFFCLCSVIFIFWQVPSFIGEGLDPL